MKKYIIFIGNIIDVCPFTRYTKSSKKILFLRDNVEKLEREVEDYENKI